MSEQPPDSGAPESSPPGPPGPPPGYVPPGPPPQPPYNPYAQPPGPQPTQPVWQGHQAPQQGQPGGPGYPQAGSGRRTWLIVLAVVLFLTVTGGAITAAVLIADEAADEGVAVAEIEADDCFNSDGLGETGGSVGTIELVDCADEHDAEVFATLELAADEDIDDAGANCVNELDDAGQTWSALDAAGLEVRPLVDEDEGDEVVCFIRHQDGEPLTGSEFE